MTDYKNKASVAATKKKKSSNSLCYLNREKKRIYRIVAASPPDENTIIFQYALLMYIYSPDTHICFIFLSIKDS